MIGVEIVRPAGWKQKDAVSSTTQLNLQNQNQPRSGGRDSQNEAVWERFNRRSRDHYRFKPYLIQFKYRVFCETGRVCYLAQYAPVKRSAFRLVSDCFVLSCAFVFTVGKNDGSVNGKKYFSWWVFPKFLVIFLVLLGFYRLQTP